MNATDQVAQIDRRTAEISDELRPLRQAIAVATRGSPVAPSHDPSEAANLKADLRRAYAQILLGRGSLDTVTAIKAALTKANARAAKALSEAEAAAELQQLGAEGIRELSGPLEDALGQLATQRERAERRVMREGLERAAHTYRASLRALGAAWAELIVHAELLSQRERIGTGAQPPIAERLSVPFPYLNTFDRLPALPALEAFANCPTPAVAVTFGDPRQERPAGNEIYIDHAAVASAVRQRLEVQLSQRP